MFFLYCEKWKSTTQKAIDVVSKICYGKSCVVGDKQERGIFSDAVSVSRLVSLVFYVLGQRLVIFAPGIRVVAVVVSRPDVHPRGEDSFEK